MDFGKLPSVDLVNFDLPPEPASNLACLTQKVVKPRLYIGATGYNMKAWVGKWYPAGTSSKDYLRHYGRQFNTIEHNTTHYRIPDPPTVNRWKQETPEDFRFCPKLPQTISHARDLGLSGSDTRYFANMVQGLGDKLGHCFMQLPPGFSLDDTALLRRFLEQFPAGIPLALEVRHPSFFQPSFQAEAYFNLLQHFGVATVITDVAGRRDVCHMRLTTNTVLIRFVGNQLHPSDYTRVSAWAGRLAYWFENGLESAYFFTHEPDNLEAPTLAAFCLKTFSAALPGVAMRGPAMVSGQQGSLF